MKTDLINTHWTCKITPVFDFAIQDYRHTPGRSSPGSNVGAFLYQRLDSYLCAWIVFIQCVIDMLLFDLSVVLVDQILHCI